MWMQVVPILRAGPVLLEKASAVLPSSETYHVAYTRDEVSLQVTMYPPSSSYSEQTRHTSMKGSTLKQAESR